MLKARSMAVAYIRHCVNTKNVELVFHYQNSSIGIDRIFNFQRNIDETVDTTLNRIKNNFEKELKRGGKKKKPKTDQQSVPIEIDLITEKDETTTWSNVLAKANEPEFESIILKICEQQFHLTYNYPYVNQLQLPSAILVDFDCYPAKFEVFFTERDKCTFEWYRGTPTSSKNDEDIVWQKCEGATGFFYIAQSNDRDHKLKV